MAITRGAQLAFTVPLYDAGSGLPVAVVPTVTVSKDGGAFAAATNTPTTVTGYGCLVTLTATEMNAGVVVVRITGASISTRDAAITTDSQTGDAFARLGAPTGASIAADVAAAKTLTAAYDAAKTAATQASVDAHKAVSDGIAAKTVNLPASPAATGAKMDLVTNAVNPDSVQTGAMFENALTASAYAHIGASVRTELTTELGRIDAAVTTRATPTNVTDATAVTNGKVDAVKAVADAVLVDTGTDIPALIAAAKAVIDRLLKWNNNKRIVTATTQTVYDDDDTTPLYTQSIGVDGTTFTRNKAT